MTIKTALLEAVAQQLEQAKQTFEQAVQNANQTRRVIACLPDALPCIPQIRVGAFVYQGDVELQFNVQTREEVGELFSILPAQALYRFETGCTSFVPEGRLEQVKAREIERGNKFRATRTGALLYRIEQYIGKMRELYSWYTVVDGLQVAVTVIIEPAVAKVRLLQSVPHIENSVTQTWNYSGLPAGNMLFWAGAHYNVCQPITVEFAVDSDISHALQTTSPDFQKTVEVPRYLG